MELQGIQVSLGLHEESSTEKSGMGRRSYSFEGKDFPVTFSCIGGRGVIALQEQALFQMMFKDYSG